MNSELTGDDYFDVENEVAPPAVTLERLTELADKAKVLEKEIEVDLLALSEKQDEFNKIVRDLIPSIMDELGLSEFKMVDGSSVKVENKLNASISEDHKPEAFAWLEENEFDGIIKTKVMVEFGKGEMDMARKALAALSEAGFDGSIDRNVHPMTLKSFVKERLEEETNIPIDVFGVFEFKQAKITPPKQPRKSRR